MKSSDVYFLQSLFRVYIHICKFGMHLWIAPKSIFKKKKKKKKEKVASATKKQFGYLCATGYFSRSCWRPEWQVARHPPSFSFFIRMLSISTRAKQVCAYFAHRGMRLHDECTIISASHVESVRANSGLFFRAFAPFLFTKPTSRKSDFNWPTYWRDSILQ